MPEYVFQYSQGRDIRWYASDPVAVHGSDQSALNAIRAKKRVTFEHGRWLEWLETSTSFGVCYGLATFWIIKKGQGEDFLAWLKPGSRACPDVGNTVHPGGGQMVADVKEMQLAQHGKDCVLKLDAAITRIKQATGLVNRDSVLVKEGNIRNKQGFSLIVIIGNRRGAGAQNFGGQGDFNHAIATYAIAEDNVLLFDPNCGEMKFSCVEETNQFIHWLCTGSQRYNLGNYRLQWAALAPGRIKKGRFS